MSSFFSGEVIVGLEGFEHKLVSKISCGISDKQVRKFRVGLIPTGGEIPNSMVLTYCDSV